MTALLIIVAIYILGSIFEKSDRDREKEAEKLPSFTKEEAEKYYNSELKSKQKNYVKRTKTKSKKIYNQ
jgi:hypothetical protein